MEEHLKHLALLAYSNFFNTYDEFILSKYMDKFKGEALKNKTRGLIYHDRILVQDVRLPYYGGVRNISWN